MPNTHRSSHLSLCGPYSLFDLLKEYLDTAQIEEVYRAYLFAENAHKGQYRKTGEPYICHPIAVACILAEMHLDYRAIMAALLHDVIEDTKVLRNALEQIFGPEVLVLVEGVTKLEKIQSKPLLEAQGENLRKMFLVMAKDIRVILIKLADRLHNMRTLGAVSDEQKKRVAQETLELFAPMANRLGLNHVRSELEDLGFFALEPQGYQELKDKVSKVCCDQQQIISDVETALADRLYDKHIFGRVEGRTKNLYSIHQKMRRKGSTFSEIRDLHAFRIVVDTLDTCYLVLGIVHTLYQPVPGRFKDYIAIPKANGYQSLHTTVVGPHGPHMEIQIRTEEMDRVAEIGIASIYKNKKGNASDMGHYAADKIGTWIEGVLEAKRGAEGGVFAENIKLDLVTDDIYVLTPKGKILELPRGSTSVDFAYKIHTELGQACVSAEVDGQRVPLRTRLVSGQTVTINRSPKEEKCHPDPNWLEFVATAKARSKIRDYLLENFKRQEAVLVGRRALERVLADDYSKTWEDIPKAVIATLITESHLESEDELMAQIGWGNCFAVSVAHRLVQGPIHPQGKTQNLLFYRPLIIQERGGAVVTYGKCCRPIPGDKIMGFVSTGRGVVVHTHTCKAAAEHRNHPERWTDVRWDKTLERSFLVELEADVANSRGMLAAIATSIANLDSNVEGFLMKEEERSRAILHFTLAVHDRNHLARIIQKVRKLSGVFRVARSKH